MGARFVILHLSRPSFLCVQIIRTLIKKNDDSDNKIMIKESPSEAKNK
jgi:hypothetical protein